MPSASLRADLERLAHDLRWAFHGPTRTLFSELDPEAWQRTGRNPVALLATIDDDRLAAVDPGFEARVRDAVADLAAYHDDQDTWYAQHGGDPGRTVVYYSAEFGIADCLHTYSGGLGVLAGDHLRSASDLGIPLIGVGLAYRDGFFRQRLGADGWQHHDPAANDWHRAPVEPVVDATGERVTIAVELGDGEVAVQAWRVQVGRVPLYLLDTDVETNSEPHRAVTGQLYGGDEDTRLRQELVLGVGGVRLLAALGIEPDVHHLNEGHAAFAGLERLRRHLGAGNDLATAIERVREELVFTTHTPVAAGHDEFPHPLASYHLGPLVSRLGVPFERVWDLATGEGDEKWSMTVLALRLAGRSNGVARLHGEVSRRMWARLYPGRSVEDVPISHVTNGVHPGMWVGDRLAELYDERLGPDWRRTVDGATWTRIHDVELERLWDAHVHARWELVAAAREQLTEQARRLGTGPDGSGLDPEALTIGFARRFATYKRATLLAHDRDRLVEIVADPDRPVQVLIAGKAHPRDDDGKRVLQQLVELSRDPALRGRLVFLEGYDLALAHRLVTGVDVWLNNPLRPLEASGTSGMKAAMNGVLNLSILDGWWDEAVADHASRADVGFGWAIGDRDETGTEPSRRARDAASLYDLLADEVVPAFYERDDAGLPGRWVAMMRDSVALLSPAYSTHRMVANYVTHAYEPAPASSGAAAG
jgi:glycogen phosphorylase